MAQNSMEKYVGEPSHENSVSTLSTKEFLELEKSCEKDSDDEIKSIFQQIKKLSGAKSNVNNNIVDEELDDVELILKKAEELAQETQSILKSGATISKHITHTQVSNVPDNGNESVKIPVIKVTRAKDIDDNGGNNRSSSEVTKLHTLQLSHEKELMQMNMQIYPLQEEIQVLNRTVDILQDRLRNCDEKLMHYHEPEINGGGDNGNGKNIYKKNAH